jgi:ABC-type uncharacterized transport system permease subunit
VNDAVTNEQAPTPAEKDSGGQRAPEPSKGHSLMRQIVAGDAFAGVLAVVLAVLVGSVMVAATDDAVRETAGYVFARPGDFFSAVWEAVWGAYTALFRGAVYNNLVTDFSTQIRPLTETLKFAAPLILAGLGVGLGFRAGLFNIGGRGQMLLAGGAAGYVGFNFDLPVFIHLPLAIVVGTVVGALWAGLAGVLRRGPVPTR